MKSYYNLYYRAKKINRIPASEEEIKEIYKCSIVRKQINNKMEEIPVSKIRIVKCTIV